MNEEEFKKEYYPRAPLRHRQPTKGDPNAAWQIEGSFREVVAERIRGFMHAGGPVRVEAIVPNRKNEESGGMTLIYPESIKLKSSSQMSELTYVKLIVGANGKYKVASLGPGD